MTSPNGPSHLAGGQCCAERWPEDPRHFLEFDFPWKMKDLANRTGKWKLCFPTVSGFFSDYWKCWICKTVRLVRSTECTLIWTWLVIWTILAPNSWTGNVKQTNTEIKQPFCLNLINFPGTLLILYVIKMCQYTTGTLLGTSNQHSMVHSNYFYDKLLLLLDVVAGILQIIPFCLDLTGQWLFKFHNLDLINFTCLWICTTWSQRDHSVKNYGM